MSIRMRHTSGHTRNRRSHHALKEPRLTRDTKTGSVHLRHRVDMKTGMYRGRQVFDPQSGALLTKSNPQLTKKKTDKKEDKKTDKKEDKKVTPKSDNPKSKDKQK